MKALLASRWWFGGLTALAFGALAGCGPVSGGTDVDPGAHVVPPTPPGEPPIDDPDWFPQVPETPACDATITVSETGNALVVTDPAVLSRFSLDRVLGQIIDLAAGSGAAGWTPDEALRRMFDTQNDAANAVFPGNAHCDDADNKAFKNGPAVDCPRAEGTLASSDGLFIPGDPDYFAPVALVNRFDLMPQSLSTCGEHRIVYAKWSGRTDPADRLFVIFEGIIPNPWPGHLMGCRAVAEAWGSLDKETDPEVIGQKLEELYFNGIGTLMPLVHPNHFGITGNEDDPYGSSKGQVRVSQRMQDPWEMREYRLMVSSDAQNTSFVSFEPSTVKNNPRPELFNLTTSTEKAVGFREEFLNKDLWNLAQKDFRHIRMQTSNMHNGGESAVSGDADVSYLSQATGVAGQDFVSRVGTMLESMQLGQDCPPEDPLDAQAIVNRASMLTCAGCHAPEKFLGPERRIGCGLTWPSTLGEVHIDETGTLSPALKEVFLPRRANVLETYLQACDETTIHENLEPGGFDAIPK
jgi:hypothetical protein